MKPSLHFQFGSGLMGWVVTAIALAFEIISLKAAPSDISDVVGVHEMQLSSGPNFISAPLHKQPFFRGSVSAVAGTTVSIGGSPGWTVNQFGPLDSHTQFVLILRHDASATPGNEGDWWPITANAAATLSVNARGDDLTTLLVAGDDIEVRHLVSLKDLFGTGPSVLLNKDSDGSANPNDEDVIYFVSGTSFSSEAFYHDGSLAPAGYYVDGDGPFDGSTLTIGPDEPLMVFRKRGSAALNTLLAGNVQSTSLTHYLKTGPNPVGTGFPVDSPIGSSGLLESGWLQDSNGSPSPAEEDVLYTVSGSSFMDEVFYHDGSLVAPGWYANGTADDSFPLASGHGLILFVKNPTGLQWREAVPF